MPHGRVAISQITFRDSAPEEDAAIRELEARAFGREEEADLALDLMAGPVETLSLVAVREGRLVGHLLFSRIEGPERCLALAPLAVDPDFREMYVGTELVRHGLKRAREAGWKSVFVLGEPNYYGRFGFRSELADPAVVEWQGPFLLAMELEPDALAGWSGPLVYPEPFSKV
ncbi:GNAT family N-acetyltransferase [Pseudohoeflea suaedae]|nr:N-acetyltransferase [Pseudohoeflea suaedae]